MNNNVILEVKHLYKDFRTQGKTVHAVRDVSFEIMEGEIFGIVGESGCGKTTCGKSSIGLLKKTDGEVRYRGRDIHRMSRKERYELSGKVQMIFQDPYSSLDPRMKIKDIVAEGIRYHRLAANKEEESEMVTRLLNMVGLNGEQGNRYPYEFSGGQRQRIGIARALAVNPEFLLCDEPISALDVSIQAQIVNLLKRLQRERNLSMIFIAHDLPMVRYIADRIAGMYLGRIVELADSEDLCGNPQHPYTKALISAVPVPDRNGDGKETTLLEGELPSPTQVYEGCAFADRCPMATESCRTESPELKEVKAGHYVACHRCR